MSKQHTRDTIIAASQKLILACKEIIRRILGTEQDCQVMSHRHWDEVTHFARLARDLEESTTTGEGPVDGPHSDWRTMPHRFLEVSASVEWPEVDGVSLSRTNPQMELAVRMISEGRNLPTWAERDTSA